MSELVVGSLVFGPFRLEGENARLVHAGKAVALTPKAFEVLRYLAARPDRLVTKEELLTAVWPDVFVSDASVKVCVREIRKALGDGVKTPKYIETVHRRGYRFIARPVEAGGDGAALPREAVAFPEVQWGAEHLLVGREEQMGMLQELRVRAAGGERQCIFIAGGPGSGKTALVESFLAEAGGATVLVGHCFEQFGGSEPYMPLWEALGRIELEGATPGLAALIDRHATAHLAAPPAGASEPRSGSERMLRDIVDGLEALAGEGLLILALEDVHWADHSTLNLISALARRRGQGRIMVVATYRPVEGGQESPVPGIIQGLLAARLGREMRLANLDSSAVGAYLAQRFAGSHLPPALAARLYQRTQGHPLFLVHLVDDLVEQGVLRREEGVWQLPKMHDGWMSGGSEEGSGWLTALDTRIPSTVRAMIELQLGRLEESARRALEAAAVAGVEFSAAAVAAALDGAGDVVQAERVCEHLARRHRLLEAQETAEWPDGTAATHYRFVHAMYHSAVYDQIPLARRGHLHQRVGLRTEQAWGGRAAEEAAALAMHFERGRDWGRAVKYLRQAAHAAARQYAHREAVAYLKRALGALERLPAAERAQHELGVLLALGVNLQVTRGFASPEVEEIHARADILCRGATGDARMVYAVLWGIWVFHKVRSNLVKAAEMGEELLRRAGEIGDPALMLQAYQAMCVTALCRGRPAAAQGAMAAAAAIYDPERHPANTEWFGQDPGVATLAFGGVALGLAGEIPAALEASRRALELARRSAQPSSLALAMHFAAMLHQCRGDAAEAERWAQGTIELSSKEGFSFWLAGGIVLRGWAWVARSAERIEVERPIAEAGLAEIRRGIAGWLETGSRTYHAYYLGLLADALLRMGETEEGLRAAEEGLAAAQALGEGLYEAELHRLHGVALLRLGRAGRGALERALAVAREQGARGLAERAEAELAGTK